MQIVFNYIREWFTRKLVSEEEENHFLIHWNWPHKWSYSDDIGIWNKTFHQFPPNLRFNPKDV